MSKVSIDIETCELCAAVVKWERREKHADWHQWLDRMLKQRIAPAEVVPTPSTLQHPFAVQTGE